MKNFKFLKRIICLGLILCMLFSLTACSRKAEAQGQNLYVSAKGIGTATLKLKIVGTFPEGTSPVISYIDKEMNVENLDISLDQIISVTEKEIAVNRAEYLITGISAGMDELKISFVKDDISYSRIIAGISVGSDLKISDCVLNISETQDSYALAGGIQTDILDDYYLEFQLPADDGNWQIESYDDSIITVSGPYYDDETGETSLRVCGNAEGQTVVSLVNTDGSRKINVDIESYNNGTDEDGELFVKVISTDEEEIDEKDRGIDVNDINKDEDVSEYTDENGETKEISTESSRIENLYIPENYVISDASEFEDSKSNPVIEMEMKNGDDFFFINAWGGKSLSDVRSEVTDTEVRKTLQTVTVAGIETEYYNVSGVDLFLFERECVVYLVSFPKESDIEAHKKVIESIEWTK